MTNADLIQELMKQANLTQEEGDIVGDIFANNFTAGGGAEDIIVNLIAEKLGVDKKRAKDIYAIGVTVLTSTGDSPMPIRKWSIKPSACRPG